MKHYLKIFALTLSLSNITAQETVAVLEFEGIGVSQDEAKALSARFGSEFMDLSKGRYTLVERQQMGEILEEQGLQQSGCVSSECAVEVGAALGAKFIIIGSISKVGTIFSINARMLDVESSQILKSINHDQVGDIGLLLTTGMREASAKLLEVGTTSEPEPVVTTGSFTVIALESGITLHNVQTGEYIADAPTTTPEVAKDMEPGIYSFLAKKSGYQDQIFKVEVFAGEESKLTITGLRSLMGTFTINVNTDSAMIYINDDFVGISYKNTFKSDSLTYGDYTVEVGKVGYEDYSSYNENLASINKEIDVYLIKSFPLLTISVEPSGSNLTIDETQDFPNFNHRTFKLEPGVFHPIFVSKDGYVSQRDSFYLDYGDNIGVNIILARAVAEIRFNVNVDYYNVYENNKSIRSQFNNNTLSNVEFGFHNYLFTEIKYEPLEVGINVEKVGMINQNVSLVRKSPQKAFRKSLLLPGTGQFYAENKGKGILMMSLHIGAGYLIYDNYTKYNDSIALKDEFYLKYKSATDLNSIATNHAEYETHLKDANDAAGMLMTFGATFAVNWVFSAVDALLFSGL